MCKCDCQQQDENDKNITVCLTPELVEMLMQFHEGRRFGKDKLTAKEVLEQAMKLG